MKLVDDWGECWRRCSQRWESFGRTVKRAAGWRVWNPGKYGERWHSRFRQQYPLRARPIVVFGLNPGPYGMAQTGIPFTDVMRLRSALPKLAAALEADGEAVEVPALAPTSLRPFLTRTFESSSVRIYRFLSEAFGSAERGVRRVVVANPCPLLFLDGESGKNVTPADLRRAVRPRGGDARALQAQMDRLRWENAEDTLATLRPRQVVLLGRDVQAALGPALVEAIGAEAVLDWEHPARAVPAKWSAGLQRALVSRGIELAGRA